MYTACRTIAGGRSILAALACLLLLSACTAGPGATAAGGAVAPAGAVSPAGSSAGSAAPAGAGLAGGCGNPAGSAVGAVGGPYASILGAVLCAMPDVDPCAMISKADVQGLFSAQLGDPTTDHQGTCDFHLADPSLGDGLNVYVVSGSDFKEPYDTNMGPVDGSTVQALSGVGDQAKWSLLAGYFPMVESYKGQVSCELTAAGGDGQLKVATTGQDMFAAIDPTALPGFIARFGALCNQVFAANPPPG